MVKEMVHQTGRRRELSTYERYLRTDELLALQKAEGELAHHDELQFQVVHQVFELWWKESAFELRTIRTLLGKGDLPYAIRLMQRVIRTQHLMLENLRMLESMTPWEFHAFRKVLEDGAGTDSPGFHALMRLSPLLWDDYKALLEREGVTLIEVHTQPQHYPLLLAMAEALIDYDEIFQLFRAQHFKLAIRMIGPGSMGTGGTSMQVLERTLRDAFYPELWQVRNELTELANQQGER
ncbi:tryptophan 2,3-dioxygenase [Ktedonobacter sp. SOSP1-52]|uniref:tryptophan 2,3-dioxygenase family protein n=1 Tax=Ktedonobacter sp. SOSP1-52 TaxID=2778366 RepID=UPI0019164E08|nr:tryptophan 2,3-dioxygenase family protein [Ktedonobacter sp. SOSP1-52]GHO69437.1 tryptophan 2,3-dioxygenase [Ktedonobacter sp. SOSP1-52]